MFTEADDSLPQLVSPQTIREGPQLPLHLRPCVHTGEQLPERQPEEEQHNQGHLLSFNPFPYDFPH